MAERLAYLEAVVGADITQFRKSMRDIRNDVGILSETIGGIGGMARTMTFAFTAPMVALGTYAVQAASGFDAAMRNINSILGLSEDQFASLQSEVFDFAKTTRAGVIPATEALYEVFSAGITDQERAIAVWKTSVMVAEAGLADLSQTTNAITATMSAYNLETTEAERVGNIWTRMVQVGVGSLGDFLSNSQKVLPLSAALNVSLEDMGATLAFLSQGGGGARKAETAYAMMLSNLLKPTEAAKNAFQALGVASGEELIAKFGSVSAAIKGLYDEVGAVQFNTMFSKTGLEAALRITENFDAMQEAIKTFNEGLDTATLDAWSEQAKSFAMQWDLMKTSIGAVAILIGQAIIPLIAPLVVGFADFLTQLTEINPQLVSLGVMFVGIVAAAGPLVWLITSLLNPLGLVAAAVVTLGGAVATNFNNIQTTIGNAISTVLGDMEPLKTAFDTFMNTLFPAQQDIPNADTPIVVNATDRIVVDKPMSLWDIYKAQGYEDLFTWDAFYDAAIAGGWEGGVINIDDEITIAGGFGLGETTGTDFRTGFQSGMDGIWEGVDGGDGLQNNPLQRLGTAIRNAWPQLQSSLNTMWSNFKLWVTDTAIPAIDSYGGRVLNAIAGWFNTSASNFEGDGAVYDAITGVMTTDVAGGIGDAASAFSAQFPQLTAALGTLFTNMGAWIEAEGLPTLARSVGFVAGRIASLLVDGLGMLFGGADEAAAGAGSLLGTSIVTPLMEGVSEGAGDVEGDTLFDNFLEKIGAGILLAAGAWVIAPGVVTAVATPIITMVGAAFTTAAASSTLISGWATAAAGIASIVSTGLLTAFGLVGVIGLGAIILNWIVNDPTLSAGLAAWDGIIENFLVIVTTVADQVRTALGILLRDVGASFFGIRIKLAEIDYLVNPNQNNQALLQSLNAEQQAFTIISTFEDSLNSYVSGASANLDISGLVWGITGRPNADGAIAPAEFTQYLRDNFFGENMLFAAIQRAADDEMLAQDLEILLPVAVSLASEDLANDPNAMLLDLVTKSGLDVDTIATAMKQFFADDPVVLDQIDVAVTSFKLLWGENGESGAAEAVGTQVNGELSTATTTTTTEIPVTPVIEGVDTAVTTWADSVASSLPTAVTTAVAANAGDMNASATSMTQPFVDAFTTAFAPEGTVGVIWTTFLTDFITDVTLLQTTVEEKAPLIQTAMTTAMNEVKLVIMDVKGEIDKLLGALDSLGGKVITFTLSAVQGDAGVAVDGSHATGLDYVPKDGYIAELHKGEAVLPASEADDYRSRIALPETQSSGTIDNSQTAFNFYETVNFDNFLREAERRGYKIERYKRK
jgi:TP901 family phage tail tape measure protein